LAHSSAKFPGHPCHLQLIRQRDTVFFCSQNIAEFWNVATPPTDKNGLGLSQEEVLQEVASIETLLTLLPDISAIYTAWKAIVRAHKVQSVQVYDARLVALMNVYAIEGILTFNDDYFKRYRNITVIHLQLLSPSPGCLYCEMPALSHSSLRSNTRGISALPP
jgi:predicted nucleic acid-binding protein